MRILVTNDDGIDSVGLHVLARAMRPHGEVVVVAPDQEYSGYSAAIGSVWAMRPEVRTAAVDGIDEAWAVNGPPALCAMFGRLGAFGPIDLVVSGINPGANVGRSVYHSGTVGAALTARNGGISAVAVSQSVDDWGVMGQAAEEVLAGQHWDAAATVAAQVVEALVADLPERAVVVNINVPNLPTDRMQGWKRTGVGSAPPRAMATAELVAKPGHTDTFHVEMSWGESMPAPTTSDTGAVMAGFASVTWLGVLDGVDPVPDVAARTEGALDDFFAPT